VPRGSLLDVGCGSGVLAIAAAKLGFAPVVALDSDATAVDVAARNAAANGVVLEIRWADAFAAPLPESKTIVANITLEAAVALAPRLTGERLIVSGFLASERPQLPGFRLLRRRQEEGWAADLFARQ
jgi:ribosomal protein L11 methyltransferase